MSDLRTRIAAALGKAWLASDDPGPVVLADLADAVIRELKLEVEDGECGYCRAQLPGCRYVTEWENPND